MTQTTVCRCGFPYSDGDIFCGNCGSQRVLPAVSVMEPATGGRRQRLGAPYFTHAAARPPEPMGNATRYLCAAAYLDPSFSNRVIRELVGSHRAVIPSRGIDLVPIVRHCLKARKMQLIRDVLLSILLSLGLILATGPLVLILVITFLLGFLPGPHWERRSFGGKAVAALAGVGAAAVIGGFVVVLLFFYLASKFGGAGGGLPVSLLLGPATVLIGLIYVCLVAGTLVYYCYVRNRTLGEWLSPGAQSPPFERSTPRVETRLAEIDAAQHGNLTLYSGEDPFLGSGDPPFKWRKADERIGANERAWSICIELNREGAPRNIFDPEPRGQVRIDPVELHGVLRKRLYELNDPALPPNERIGALTVDDHVVGEGRFRWDSPLVDAKKLIPYSQVRPEAITALIRNPQARLRYYQRVSISDEGQTVLAEEQPVIGSVDQEVVVSAFVYVAVEGHMFYLQFVPTSLAPIGDHYHLIDHLPRITSGKFLSKVVIDTARNAFHDLIGAPLSLYRTLRLMWQENKSFNEELTHSKDFVYADIGARISVRQFGARLWPRTYIQQLDVAKYTQIVERLVLESTLDFLVAKGVDTTAYRAAAQTIYNSGVIVGGNNQNSPLTQTR
ncbi:MAG: hypothetical protein QOG28_4547 [Trebonia sp.]|nr:hypothetical protein [Trebonia sp.]